jgi:cytochrome c oxidase assembly factor 5
MPSNCKEIREELIECMLKSKCVLVQRNTVKECFKKEHEADVPAECQSIRKSFAECRRGMVKREKKYKYDICKY